MDNKKFELWVDSLLLFMIGLDIMLGKFGWAFLLYGIVLGCRCARDHENGFEESVKKHALWPVQQVKNVAAALGAGK